METKTKRGGADRTLNRLVLFLSDLCWFLKGWHPLTIKWEDPYKTKFRWGLARKRHAIKKRVSEIKKQNDESEARDE